MYTLVRAFRASVINFLAVLRENPNRKRQVSPTTPELPDGLALGDQMAARRACFLKESIALTASSNFTLDL